MTPQNPPQPKRNDIGCAQCDQRWTGTRTCHCGKCHHTFTGLEAFDQHRTGQHHNDTRRCLHPTEAGLVKTNRTYECWKTSKEDDRWQLIPTP